MIVCCIVPRFGGYLISVQLTQGGDVVGVSLHNIHVLTLPVCVRLSGIHA